MDREKSAKMNRMDFSSVKCQDLGFVITHRTGGRAALWTRPATATGDHTGRPAKDPAPCSTPAAETGQGTARLTHSVRFAGCTLGSGRCGAARAVPGAGDLVLTQRKQRCSFQACSFLEGQRRSPRPLHPQSTPVYL